MYHHLVLFFIAGTRYRIHSITASLLSPFSSTALLPSLLRLPALRRLFFLPALRRHHNHVGFFNSQ